MAEHASRLPFALDPLIAEAKQRMRRRRFGLAATLLAAACLTLGLTLALRPRGPVLPQGASPAFARVGWSGPIKINGRIAIGATVSWIRCLTVALGGQGVPSPEPDRAHPRPVRTLDSGWGVHAVTAGQLAHPVQCSGSTCFDSRAASFRPALPRTLPPGARWTSVSAGQQGSGARCRATAGPASASATTTVHRRGSVMGAGADLGSGTPIGRPVHIR